MMINPKITEYKEKNYGSGSNFDCDTFTAAWRVSSGGNRGSVLVEHPFDAFGIYPRHRACCLDYCQTLKTNLARRGV